MKRRTFITLLSGAAAWPMTARAQQRKPLVGFLRSTSRDDSARLVLAFQQGLKLGGYFDGQNVAIEYRWGEGRNDRMPSLIADLVRAAEAGPAPPPASPLTPVHPARAGVVLRIVLVLTLALALAAGALALVALVEW